MIANHRLLCLHQCRFCMEYNLGRLFVPEEKLRTKQKFGLFLYFRFHIIMFLEIALWANEASLLVKAWYI